MDNSIKVSKVVVNIDNKYNLIIFGLMMLDYILTYAGIHHFNCITEGNFFMVWLFEIPFITGGLVRAVQCLMICSLLKYIQINGSQYYNKFIKIVLLAEIWVMLAHLVWILGKVSLFIYEIYLIAQIRV